MTQIDSTKFGEITIDGEVHNSDVFIFWTGEVIEGETAERHLFSTKEFSFLFRRRPEIVIVGTGQYGGLGVAGDVTGFASENDIWLITMDTPKAIQRFNELVKAKRKVAAFMHVTC